MHNIKRGDKWLPGAILSKEGSVTYHVELNDGLVRKCHSQKLQDHNASVDKPDISFPYVKPTTTEHSSTSDSVDESTSPETITQPIENQESTSTNQSDQPDPVYIPTSSSAFNEQPYTDVRHSTWIHNQTVRYKPML